MVTTYGGPQDVIDLISDGDESPAPENARENASSTRQKAPESSVRQKPLGQMKHSMATKAAAPRPRIDLTSTHSGSQPSRPRSQNQQPLRSAPSIQNSTLAQRAAGRGSSSRDSSSIRQLPRTASNSSGRATSPAASQVQISRGVTKSSGVLHTGETIRKADVASIVDASKKKRSPDRADDAEKEPTTKRLKSSQDHRTPLAKRSATLSGLHASAGAGINSNPIVIPDSPSPSPSPSAQLEATSMRNSSPLLPPQPSKTPIAKTSQGPSEASGPEPVPADITGGSRDGRFDGDGQQVVKSPTIPESLPGSPSETNIATTATKPHGSNLPLFNQPLEQPRNQYVDKDFETISSFADEVLNSQAESTSANAEASADTPGKPPADSRSNHLGEVSTTSLIPSGTRSTLSSTVTGSVSKPGVIVSVHNKPEDLPRTAARNMSKTTQAKGTPANNIEQVIKEYVQELRGDNVYWNRTWFRRARHMIEAPTWRSPQQTSAFRDMKAIQLAPTPDEKRMSDLSARFTMEIFKGGGKSSKRSYTVPCTMYHTPTDADVPNYSHFVSIKNSFLAKNETVLQHWPYFHDDFDNADATELALQYYLDVVSRERKIKRLAQAENYADYVEDMLRDIDCTWSDVLRFLLDPEPDVGTNPEALAALRNRHKLCDEDFVRGSQRWTTVLSKLPSSNDPDRVGRAGLLCEYFKKIAKLQIWHVARRSGYTSKLLEEEQKPKPDLNEMTCRVCMRFNCPYHGEIHEKNPASASDSEEDGSAADEVVETDIIHPHRVNFRSRVQFPPKVDEDEPGAVIDPKRRKTEYWHKMNLHHFPGERRGPFYPCYHPGTTCEKVRCSCFVNRTPCEKSCACPPSCKRKWQGCDCRKKSGSMVCFEDSRCACFQLGRECDVDLCGDCGVVDVLDPVQRHDEGVLHGRCHNANIQRGVPRHTILGDSGIHGLGLYACEDIQHHDFVGEYKGEIITKNEAERRGAVYEHQKLSYLFSLNNKQEIDSTLFGNKIRFINHADGKKANLYPRIIMVNTVFRIALYGSRKLKAGQELMFDYGPFFPQDQLGSSGKANKERKAAPHVRNKNLIAEFDEVVEETDKFGNRRARKAAAGNKRGQDSGAASTRSNVEYTRDALARKSTGYIPDSDRGELRARKSMKHRPDPNSGESRSGADRSVQDEPEAEKHAANAEALPLVTFDEMHLDAGQRLSSYNVADDEDTAMFHQDDEEDLDFAPPLSSDDQGEGEDGGDEDDDDDDDDEDDDEDGLVATAPTRPRSSRRRR